MSETVYVVFDKSGTEIKKGDTITNFRGETNVFDSVTRGPEYNETAKITTDNREVYARVYDLQVMTDKQVTALRALRERYNMTFDPTAFKPRFDLPAGYVAGLISGTLYVGCSPDGRIMS